MSSRKVITGTDDRGRPVSEWREEGAAESGQHFGFMEPAHNPVIERRQATPQELEAMRARDEPPVPRPPTIVRRSLATPEEGIVMPPEIHVVATEPEDAPDPLLERLQALRDATGEAQQAWMAKQAAEIAATAARDAWGEAYRALMDRAAAVALDDPDGDEDLTPPDDDHAHYVMAIDVSEPVEVRPAARPHALNGLSAHQQRVLDLVIQLRGDRKTAAAQLGLTGPLNVEQALDSIGKKGLLPADLIPLLPARFAKYSTVPA